MKENRIGVGKRISGAAIRSVMIGALAGAFLCAALMTACAAGFAASGKLPGNLLHGIMLVLLAGSGFVAGSVSAKLAKERGILYGGLSGGVLAVIWLICSIAILGEMLTIGALTKIMILLLSGTIGGILAVNRKPKRHAVGKPRRRK